MRVQRPGFVVLLCATAGIGTMARAASATLPENLALRATASATSEYSEHYLAKFAIDGKIAAAASYADLDNAWCVAKARSGDHAEFHLRWREQVQAAEIVYFARMAWDTRDCWKDYEVYAEPADGAPGKAGAARLVARGSFVLFAGPQRIGFPKTKLRGITIKFLNSYGGGNPGAAEIMVFAASPSRKELATMAHAAMAKVAGCEPRFTFSYYPLADEVDPPPIDQVNRGWLRSLIVAMTGLHGDTYAAGPRHLARLDRLKPGAGELTDLQREVLLWDVEKLLVIKRHEIISSHVYTYHYEDQRDGGGLYVFSTRDRTAAPVELVASPHGQILDCDLSYDGKTVLFSWRREGEGYHVWTVNIDGTGRRQLTHGPWHDYNACWLPDGGIAFLSTRNPQFAYCWNAPVGVLYRMEADGSNARRLSGNYLNDFTPAVLDDGRIIYTRWEYVDRPAIPTQSLWTIHPDGTGLAGYFGNRKISPGTFMEARSIPGTTKIICTMTGHGGPARGAIGVIDRAKGVNAQEAIENITPDAPVPPIDQGCGDTFGEKPYRCPLPLDQVRFLVSARGPILVRTIAGDCQSTVLPRPADGMQYFNAQPVRRRPRPPSIPSTLPLSADGYATLYLQDVYDGLEPYVRRGEVTALRVIHERHKPVRIDLSRMAFGFQFPVISCGATYAAKDVLGEVPVEPDGSACFRVPAGEPVYFMALDAEGRAVQRMRSFTHLVPGEVHGCIGCHEHRLRAAEPHRGSAYFNRPARDLRPPEWGAGGFDYSRVVQPVLDRYCIRCHNSVTPPKRIDLTGGKTDFFNVSYECLARENQTHLGTPYVSYILTYNGLERNIFQVTPKEWGSPRSKLAEVVLSGHPRRNGKPRFAMDERSRRRILAWIDLNVPYYGTSETAYPERRGCRQIVPPELDAVLTDVAQRRCAQCHQGGQIPRRAWVRITEPDLNPFLVAPLAKAAGGSQECGKPIFAGKDDPDYRAVLALFRPIEEMLRRRPRMDMPGAEPSPAVSRYCQ